MSEVTALSDEWERGVPDNDALRARITELEGALRWIKGRAGPFAKRSMALSMIEDVADAALRGGGES